MRDAIENIIKQPLSSDRDRPKQRLLKFALQVLSGLYLAAVCCRRLLYRSGLLKSRRLSCFVFSIGNITAGGTGKTPMTIHVADMLLKAGYKVVIISRGYKRKSGKAVLVVSDGENILCGVSEAGDEAYMMATALGCPLIVGKSRYSAGRLAIEKFNPDVILLDDAFQHLALHKDLNLLLLDSKNPFGNGALLPRGPLREPPASVERADAIVMTRGSEEEGETVPAPPFSREMDVPVFKTSHVPRVSRVVVDGAESGRKDHDVLPGNKIFLFSAIANNDLFIHSCRNLGFSICGYLEFPDHFWYTERDLERIKHRFRETRADCIGTTQKDFVKIQNRICGLSALIVFDIEICFKNEDGEAFRRLVHNRVTAYQAKSYGSEG